MIFHSLLHGKRNVRIIPTNAFEGVQVLVIQGQLDQDVQLLFNQGFYDRLTARRERDGGRRVRTSSQSVGRRVDRSTLPAAIISSAVLPRPLPVARADGDCSALGRAGMEPSAAPVRRRSISMASLESTRTARTCQHTVRVTRRWAQVKRISWCSRSSMRFMGQR